MSSGNKIDKSQVPELKRPLSDLTKDYTLLPIKNMELWVTRSTEERREEAANRNGYITRPMNSFMLYRSAYAERTKLWCLQNNHQVVSSVSGASWPLEPPAIREKYNALAKLERINHQRAHPGYKFSPSKVQNMTRRPENLDEPKEVVHYSSEDDFENTEELQAEDTKMKKRKPYERKRKIVLEEPKVSTPRSIREYSLNIKSPGGALKSSYNALNPGRTPPVCMGESDMNGQYYQTIVRPTSVVNLGSGMIEDVTIRKTATPPGQHDLRRNLQDRLLALPDCDDASPEIKIDPALFDQDDSLENIQDYGEDNTSSSMHQNNYYDFHTGEYEKVDPDSLFEMQPLGQSFTYIPNGAENLNILATYNETLDSIQDSNEYWNRAAGMTTINGDAGHPFVYDEWIAE